VGDACELHLQELVGLEAPPENHRCLRCNEEFALYRCLDCCNGQRLLCVQCCILLHQHLPFHSIQRWNGSFFASDDLQNLGLSLHLGHGGAACRHFALGGRSGDLEPGSLEEGQVDEDELDQGLLKPLQGENVIVFITTSGIYRRSVQKCMCPSAPALHIQLFQMRLFPATLKKPSTAFTFAVLDQFYIEAMECKTSALQFYSKLQRMTNNSFPHSVPVRISTLT
jgi:hypothetical protein